MLCFHIGLPKTATTFLQWEVLPTLAQAELIHKEQGAARDRAWLRALKHRCITGRRKRWRVRRRWRVRHLRGRLRAGAALIVSSENISMTPDAVWTGAGPGPEAVAARLAEAAGELDVPARQVRILFGLRAQAPWLASRYAESAKHNPHFDQADFEARLWAIAGADALPDPLRWLDYGHVHDALAGVFGAHNLLFLPVDALAGATPDDLRRRIAAHLGLDPDAARPAHHTGRDNRLSGDGEGWRLKSGAGRITLPEALRARIAARFAAQNARLHARTGIVVQG